MVKRPRLTDVAARVGVSPASVSLVLRGVPGPSAETRDRVLAAAAELGYRADRTASMLARRRRHLLGVMLDVRNPFHAELAEEIHVAAGGAGYEVVLATLTRDSDERHATETLLDFRSEALILLGPDSPAADLDELAAQVPCVAVGTAVRAAAVDVVRSADDVGVEAALHHLIELGHTRIAFLDGGPGPVAGMRRRGYRRALRRAGLIAEVLPGDHTEAGGIRAGRALLESTDRPTAVVASNDRLAVGLMDALLRAGVGVPEEISVIGYDDSTLARLAHIDLTSVNQNAPEQARQAVRAAVSRLDEGRAGRMEMVLVPHLVVRGSTAALRGERK
ncbi:LacI family DNA-binding transcriptional regulator [Actinoplanes aureus]|uniref:LacI family DNA-binding transcriptional regulator n=1 Tax=Actinoplanes aureus TaxID=2792083 RepID=A0A931FW61_9ACTN|nr:LacI family DNA-binding transcriptional regulator [Actinoplanes aureus]MBG0561462.1 LacI family DNA-binding transcriptional regulator [Actinoplanes aureus]